MHEITALALAGHGYPANPQGRGKPAKQRKNLGIITQSGEHLPILINKVLIRAKHGASQP
jgi:hypothetical protein